MTATFDEARQRFTQGIVHFEAGRLESAREAFEATLLLAPGRPSVLGNLGITLLRLRRFEDALPLLQQATVAEPDYVEAWTCLGVVLEALGRWEAAAGVYQTLATLLRTSASPWLRMAACLTRLSRPQQALRAYDHALMVAAKDAQAWISKGGLLRELQRLDEAAQCFEKALARGGKVELNQSDIGTWLASTQERADLIVAADGFIYVGELGAVFAAVRRVLFSRGCFAFSVEEPQEEPNEERDGQLLPSLRYAHSERYIRHLAHERGFTVEQLHRARSVRIRDSRSRVCMSTCVESTGFSPPRAPRAPRAQASRRLLALLLAGVLNVLPVGVPNLAHALEPQAPALLLAQHYSDKFSVAEYLVSEKLDGVRAYWDGKHLRFRSGRVIQAPAWFIAPLPAHALDGELWMGRRSFERLSAAVRRDVPVDDEWKAIVYHLYELPDGEGSFSARIDTLKSITARIAVPWLQVLPQERVSDAAALKKRLAAVTRAGGEGLMLHRADAAWQTGRSDVLLKMKPQHDTEAVVVAHVPGKGKYEGMLGALIVETPEGRRFRLGTGFNDAQRHAPPPVGSMVTYRYRDVTANGVPRFASFLRLRERE